MARPWTLQHRRKNSLTHKHLTQTEPLSSKPEQIKMINMPVFEMQFFSLFIMKRGWKYKTFAPEPKLNIQASLLFFFLLETADFLLFAFQREHLDLHPTESSIWSSTRFLTNVNSTRCDNNNNRWLNEPLIYLFTNFYLLSVICCLYSYTHMQCLPTNKEAKWQEVQCVKQLCDEGNLIMSVKYTDIK